MCAARARAGSVGARHTSARHVESRFASPADPCADRARLAATLTALNPGARLVEATFGTVPLGAILNTKAFSLAKAAAAPGWLRELRGSHVPESTEFGISSFVFHAARPFHPTRLHALVFASPALTGVLRSKGFVWLACDGGQDDSGLWSHAGAVFQFSTGRPWWATVPRDAWPPGAAEVLAGRPWDAVHGDRGQELVFIGAGMDRGAVEAGLRGALLTDAEFAAGPEAWEEYDDPFDFFPYEDDDEREGEGEGGDDATMSEDGGGAGGHAHGGVACSHDHGGHGHGHGHAHSAASDNAPAGSASDAFGKPSVRRIVRPSGAVMEMRR